jgi:hypothetical protein
MNSEQSGENSEYNEVLPVDVSTIDISNSSFCQTLHGISEVDPYGAYIVSLLC